MEWVATPLAAAEGSDVVFTNLARSAIHASNCSFPTIPWIHRRTWPC
jgi:hypothetical protein